MFVKPRFVQFLTSVSVAAIVLCAPYSAKLNSAGQAVVMSAAAFAQTPPDPLAPPGVDVPPGPTEPPTPPTDPVDPPTDPVDPPTDLVDPPTDPIDIPIDVCDQKDAPDSCFNPAPAAVQHTQNDGDDVPSTLPAKPADEEKTAQEDGVEFAKSLRCQTECKAEVAADGDVTVTLTSTTPEGDTVLTTIKQDGPEIETRLSINDLTVAEAKELFDSVMNARTVVQVRATDVVVTLEASGAKWAKILSDPVRKAKAITSLAPQIAEFLGVAPESVVIFSLEAV